MVENRIEVQTSLILRNESTTYAFYATVYPIPARRPIHSDLHDPARSEIYGGELNYSQHLQLYALLQDSASSTSLWQLDHRSALQQ